MMRAAYCRPSALALLVATTLAGCNLAPRHAVPTEVVPHTIGAEAAMAEAAMPDAGTPLQDAERAQATALAAWLQQPLLEAVLQQALAHNRDLRVAVDNIEKARAQYGITRADLLPSVNAQLQASRSRSSADLSNNGTSSVSEQYTAQLGFASYELDLWGRVRNLSDVALQQFLQSEDNARSVRVGLLAEVSNAWLQLGADMGRLALAHETLDSREKSYALIERMFKVGSTSGLVVAQNLASVETARGDVALYTAQVQKSRNALQLLTGGALPTHVLPGPQLLRGSEPVAGVPVPPELPSSVLLQRPDVQAAERQLRAMDASIGAARAAFFPSISLTGNVGSGSRELDNLLGAGTSTWSFAPQIRLPIFAGGRNRANLAVAEANQRVAVSQYEKAVQTAFKEVADTLAERSQWGARLGAQHGMVVATNKALELSQARFGAGVDNYLSVLDAQRSLYAAQQNLIALRQGEQASRITLWKVLGGTLQPLQLAMDAPAVPQAPAPIKP